MFPRKALLFTVLLVLSLNLACASWFGGDSHKDTLTQRIKEWADAKQTPTQLFSSIYKDAAKKAVDAVKELKQEGRFEQSRDKIAAIWDKALEDAKATARDVRALAEQMPEHAELGLGQAASHLQNVYTENFDAAKTRSMELKEKAKEKWDSTRSRLGDVWSQAATKADEAADKFSYEQKRASDAYDSLRQGISDAYKTAVEKAQRRFAELKHGADDTEDTLGTQAAEIWRQAMEEAQAEIDNLKKHSKLEDFSEAFNRALRRVKDKWAEMKEEHPFETLKEKLSAGYDSALNEAEKAIAVIRAQPEKVLSAADRAQLAFADSTRKALNSAKDSLTKLSHVPGESYDAIKDRMWDVYEKAWEAAAPPPRPKTFAEKAWESIRQTFRKGAEMLGKAMPHSTPMVL